MPTQHRALGLRHPPRRLLVKRRRIEPALAAPACPRLHVAEEGALEPLATTQALLAAAVGLGAASCDRTQ